MQIRIKWGIGPEQKEGGAATFPNMNAARDFLKTAGAKRVPCNNVNKTRSFFSLFSLSGKGERFEGYAQTPQ